MATQDNYLITLKSIVLRGPTGPKEAVYTVRATAPDGFVILMPTNCVLS